MNVENRDYLDGLISKVKERDLDSQHMQMLIRQKRKDGSIEAMTARDVEQKNSRTLLFEKLSKRLSGSVGEIDEVKDQKSDLDDKVKLQD